MKIIAGTSHPNLAIILAARLGLECLPVELTKFSDGELKVSVHGIIDKEIILVQSTCMPVNDNLIELLLLADVARRAGAERVIAIIPYLGYSRQDRPDYENSSIAANVAIKMIEAAGITEVITLELHSSELENVFNIPISNLKTNDIFLPIIQNLKNTKNKDTIIVSPDLGGVQRVGHYASLLNVDLAIINKIRGADNLCVMSGLEGDVNGKHCILIDDMVGEGSTICLATEFLLSKGAISVEAVVTHGVFSRSAIAMIQESALTHLYITDSIPHLNLPNKISVLPIHELLAEAIALLTKSL